MLSKLWRRLVRNTSRRPASGGCRLRLEALEDRLVPATIVGGSTLLTQAYADQLETWLGGGPVTISNIFTKTTSNGMTSTNFHSAADNRGPTFSVVEVLNTNGNSYQIIGGYNPQSWDSSNAYHISPTDAERTAFLFNLTTTTRFDQKLSAIDGNNGRYQTYNNLSYGPTFGGGHDLYIQSNLASGYAYKHSYGPPGVGDTSIIGRTGNPTIDFGTIEVFTISFAVPRVVLTGPALTGGVVNGGGTSLQVTFNELVVGGGNAANYELRSLGADALLGTADDTIVSLAASYSGTTATLTFAALPESVYRLTVKDSITDPGGTQLDGDNNGTAGGNWVRDFVAVQPPSSSTTSVTTGQATYFPVGGDLNGDGKDDAVLVDYGVTILLNDGAGGFLAPTVISLAGQQANRVVLGDFNGDGAKDIAVNLRSGGVGVLLNNGSGVFGAPSFYAGSTNSYAVGVGEFTGDGKDDIVSVGFSGQVMILVNNGSGVFGAPTQVASVVSVGVITGDFDLDGNVDIALSPSGGSQIGILLGNGSGGFGAVTFVGTGGVSAPYNLDVGDFNGDGKPDLAVPNNNNNTIGILLGNGLGGFTVAGMFPTGGSAPYTARVADFNLDGRLDVVTVNRSSNTIAVMLGDGSGGLGAPLLTSVPSSYPSPAVGDFTGDGIPDVLTNDWSTSSGRLLSAPGLQGIVTRLSANGLPFDIDPKTFGSGELLQGPANAFDGLNRLQVGGVDFGPAQLPSIADGGQTLVTAAQSLSGLDVHREVTVPNTGSEDFARTVDVFANPSASPITTTVRIVGNLGSDAATTVFATSDGDTSVETTDQWIGTDDADGSGTPAIIHYIHGPTAGIGLVPISVNIVGDNIEWTYSLTVPAGQTVRLASFTIVNNTRAGAIAAANTLVTPAGFGGQGAAFLTPSELTSIANFQFNRPPVADAGGPYSISEGQDLDLDASGSYDPDAGDSIVAYAWDLDNDGQYDDLATATATIPWATLQGLGIDDGASTHTIGLQVTDSFGLTNTSSTTLDLSNKAPTATFDNGGAVDEGSTGTVTFSGQVDPSDTDMTAGLRYAYDFNNDGDFSDTDEIGDGTYTNSSTLASVTVPAAYLDNNPSRTIHGRIIDQDDGYTDYYTTITVNNVAPTLVGANDFTTIDEDATGNSGDFVATLIAGQITDPGVNDPRGIAVVGLNSGNGSWEYDIGGGWTLLAAASDSSALLLRDTDKLRFVPDGMNGTTATITFRAWDRDTGTVGNTVDLSGAGATGGTTAFSGATATATIIVTDVNDAPTLAGSMTLTMIDTVDGNNQGNTVAEIFASNGGNHVADVDLGAVQGIAIIAANNALGTWQYTIDGGATWDVVGTPTASTALLLAVDTDTRLRFVSNGLSGGTARITVRAWDQTSGVNGGTADTTSNGGITAFSTATAFTSIRINTPPQLNGVPLAATINENQAFTFTASGSDSDVPSQSLTYSLSGGPSGATIGSSSGVFAWTPAENQGPATYVFDVCVSDGVTTVGRTVSLTVNEVNSAPVLSGVPVSATINEGGTLTFTASATDSDDPAQTLTFSLVNAPLGASIHSSTGAFTWTASESQGGQTFTFAIRLSDGVISVDQSISVTINETNTAPTLVGAPNSVTIDEGALYTFTAGAADSDVPTQTLTFSLVGAPTGAAISSTTGVFTWTPGETQGGSTFNFTVRVSDGVTNTDQPIDITVTETNTAPVLSAVPLAVTVAEGQLLTFTAGATDSDVPAQSLSFSIVGGPTGASIGSSSGIFTWTPSVTQGAQTYNFTIRVNDTVTNTDQAITVSVTDTPPIAASDVVSLAEGSPATTFNVLANDLGLGLSIISVTQGLNGAVAITGGGSTLTYQPTGDFNGVDSFTYTVQDGAGTQFTGVVIVAVTPVNDAPLLAAPATATILANQVTNLAGITVNDIDAGTGQMQVILSAANGTFTLNSLAGLTFSVGDGVDDSDMTFTGALASINSVLAGLGYRQARDICTTDTVDIVINDLGNTGSGGNLSAAASIAITPNYNTVLLLPDPFKANTKALVINGTTGNDTIIVSPKVNLNGTPPTTFLVTVNGGPVQTISGVTGRILVYGHDGNDKITVASTVKKLTWLSGGAGNDTIIGGGGNDWISGGADNDLLKGGAGFDRLVETGDVDFTLVGGTLTVDGSLTGLGIDVLYRNSIESAKLTGGAGDNVFSITGFAGAATIDGGAGDDTLLGRNAASVWTITSSNAGTVGKAKFSAIENLTGGTANDTFKFKNGASVAGDVDGGGGVNMLSYSLYLTAIRVNLLLGTATGVGGVISNIRNAVGGATNDILVGNAAVNLLLGNGGRDVIIGGGGKDTLAGGGGDDILIGGTTDHDDDPTNLDAIMALWASTNSYPSRITSLATLLNGATVQNDSGAIDMLTGGLGLDWFLTSTGDVVTDKNGGTETKTVV